MRSLNSTAADKGPFRDPQAASKQGTEFPMCSFFRGSLHHTIYDSTNLPFLFNTHPGRRQRIVDLVHYLDLGVVVAGTQGPQLQRKAVVSATLLWKHNQSFVYPKGPQVVNVGVRLTDPSEKYMIRQC